jgi:hypothetical protein
MPEENTPNEQTPTTENAPGATSTTTETASQEPKAPATLEEALALLEEERKSTTKWKTLSRQNEKKWEDASAERDQLKQATMTDAEKAIETARTEGRNSALSEVGTDLVSAEMALQAVTAGVTLPDAEYLNVSKFIGDNGRPNKDAIKSFVESLPKANSGQGFPNLQGAGRQSGSAGEFTSMDPNELADFIGDGSVI